MPAPLASVADPLRFLPRTGPAAGVYRRLRDAAAEPVPPRQVLTARGRVHAWRAIAASTLVADPRVKCMLGQARLDDRRWYPPLRVLRNPHLDLDQVIAVARRTNQAWRIALAAVTPALPDDVVAEWLVRDPDGISATLQHLHDVLATRPGLHPAAVEAGGPASAALATVPFLPAALTADLLARASTRTPAGRQVLRELAANPTLPMAVRQQAQATAMRHRSARQRRATTQALADYPTITGTTIDARLGDDDLATLADWASVSTDDGWAASGPHPSREARAKTHTWRAVGALASTRPALASRVHAWAAAASTSSLALPAFTAQATVLPTPQALDPRSAGPGRGTLDDQLLSAVAWDRSPRTVGIVGDDEPGLVTHLLTCELGDDAHAWEAYAGLAPEWTGTLGELVRCVRALG